MGSRLALPDLKSTPYPGAAKRAGRWLATLTAVGMLGGAALPASASPLSSASAAALEGPPKPKKKAARKHFDRAVELYSAGEYDASIEQARLGYEIEPHESLLFIEAQAERKRGNCLDAVDLFDRFIDATDNDAMRDNALTAKAMCAQELAELARQAEAERQRLEAEAAAAAEREAQEEQEEAVPPPPPPRPWHKDPLGGALVGVGGATALAGGGVLVAAAVLHPDRAGDYQLFIDRRRQRPTLVMAGAITAGIGGAVAVAGAVRWGLVARRNRRAASAAATVSVVPMLSPRSEDRRAGLVLSGRF